MTPKEKAKELFEKFYGISDLNGFYTMSTSQAKQCAIIACEEVIKYCHAEHIEYWQEVKQELENLK